MNGEKRELLNDLLKVMRLSEGNSKQGRRSHLLVRKRFTAT